MLKTATVLGLALLAALGISYRYYKRSKKKKRVFGDDYLIDSFL